MLSSSQTRAPVWDSKSFWGCRIFKNSDEHTLVARLNAAASCDNLNDMMHSDKSCTTLGRKSDDGDSATLKGSGWSP